MGGPQESSFLRLGEAFSLGGVQVFSEELVVLCTGPLGLSFARVSLALPAGDRSLAQAGAEGVDRVRWLLAPHHDGLFLLCGSARQAEAAGLPGMIRALRPWLSMALRSPGQEEPVLIRSVALEWGLTPAQARVLSLIARGLANKDIASSLGCSVKTVEAHTTQILRRSGSPGRSALVRRVMRPGH